MNIDRAYDGAHIGSQNAARGIPCGLLIAMSMAGVVLALLGTHRYGAGISSDSAGYLCAARNLLAGRGYWTLCNSPYTAWPPLFPTVLAAIGLAGIDPVAGARFLNAAAMGAIVFAAGIFLGRFLRSKPLAVMGTCSVLLSFPLLGVSTMAWTEPLFVLLIVLFVLQMSAFLRDRSISSLVIASILAGLCSLQRYMGVTLIAVGVVLVLWPGSNCGLGSRLRRLVCFTAISSTVLGLWTVRNYRLTGMFTGHVRERSIYSIWENVATAADTVTRWIMPQSVSLPARVGISSVAIVLTVVFCLYVRRKAGCNSAGNRAGVWTAGLVTLVYIPLMLYTHQIGVLNEPMNDRYLAPLAVTVLWLVFMGIDELVASLRFCSRRGSAMASAVLVLCGLWLSYPLERTFALISDQMHRGAGGYSRTEWRESSLVQWLRSHPLQDAIRSNAPDALYALAGMDAHVSPHRTWDIPGFRRMVSSGNGETLVWFKDSPRSYLYDLEELISMLPVEEIVSFADGGVYRLTASTEDGSPDGGAFSTHMVNGVRNRRFTSDTFGPRGSIASWVLREDGRMESEWELSETDGKVITWSPSCECSRSGDLFEFHCEGRATRAGNASSAPYRLRVHGALGGDVAMGEYEIEFSGEQWPAADRGWWRVDVAQPVYRWYSRRRKTHAYTMSRDEARGLAAQSGDSWVCEGVVFCAYAEGSQPPDVLPVFRFSSKTDGADFYTISEAERDQAMADPEAWDYRGVAWYAYSSEQHPPDTKAVHRFRSGKFPTCLYTMDEREKDKLLSSPPRSWAYEGIVWHALPAGGP